MKTSGLLATILLVAVALGATVWIGRYQGDPKVLIPPKSPPVPDGDVGPKIAPTGPYPKVVVDETEFDFGKMSVGQEGTHTFTIRNEGDANLELMARREDTTCQCTFGELGDSDPIPPGGSKVVTLKWKIKVRVDTFRHRALVRTNDPEHKVVELAITGKVDELFQLNPPSPWAMGEIPVGQSGTTTGTISSAIVKDWSVTSVVCANPTLTTAWEPMTAEELDAISAIAGYKIKLTIEERAPAGNVLENVSIELDSPDLDHMPITVKAHRPGPIELLGADYRKETNAVSLGEFAANQGKSTSVSMFVRDMADELKLLDVEPKSDRIQYALIKDEKFSGKQTQRYIFKVTVLPGPFLDHSREKELKLQLHFNHPKVESMTLDLRFLAK